MMRVLLGMVMLLAAAGAVILSAGISRGEEAATAAATGPTPYPKQDADWPGKGPIRMFEWLPKHREAFWKMREKDQGAVVFVGDSLTENWVHNGFDKAFPEMKKANRGIGGDTSRGVLFRFQEDVLDLHPKAIVLLCGTNDLTAFGKPADGISNISDMLAMVEKQDAATPVILCTLPPSAHPKAPLKPGALAEMNAAIKKLAGEHKNVTVCDLNAATAKGDGSPNLDYFGPDKLHLGAAGYAKWIEVVTPIFEGLKIKV